MTHLSLELCKRLKAAGFPQMDKSYVMAARSNDGGLWIGDECDSEGDYACPNSDELIAQIEAEFPGELDCIEICMGDGWYINTPFLKRHKIYIGNRKTITEALARLYIALSE